MAAAFLAMNEVYGSLYAVSPSRGRDARVAVEHRQSLAQQFIMDCHTHFLRADTKIMTFVRQRQAVGKAGWNPALIDPGSDDRGPQVRENCFKESSSTATPRWR